MVRRRRRSEARHVLRDLLALLRLLQRLLDAGQRLEPLLRELAKAHDKADQLVVDVVRVDLVAGQEQRARAAGRVRRDALQAIEEQARRVVAVAMRLAARRVVGDDRAGQAPAGRTWACRNRGGKTNPSTRRATSSAHRRCSRCASSRPPAASPASACGARGSPRRSWRAAGCLPRAHGSAATDGCAPARRTQGSREMEITAFRAVVGQELDQVHPHATAQPDALARRALADRVGRVDFVAFALLLRTIDLAAEVHVLGHRDPDQHLVWSRAPYDRPGEQERQLHVSGAGPPQTTDTPPPGAASAASVGVVSS